MKFASLGSGSSGNATLVSDGETLILIDCGFSVKETEKRLSRLELNASDITAILVTHEHSDHIQGVGALAKKYRTPVYMTEGTRANKEIKQDINLRLIKNYQGFSVGSIAVNPIVVPHDAKEPSQFVLSNSVGLRIGVLTDLGSITPHIVEAYSSCDGLLVEANHDLDMLARGPYPPSLKSRVSSDWGHLNNRQTRQLLEQLDLSRLQHLVVGHISEQNNSVERAQFELKDICERVQNIHYARQDKGFGWLNLEGASVLAQTI